jgi:sulfatase modifying factor 1
LVTVDRFWIDRHPVTTCLFKEFGKATGHVTFAEILPDPKDYPGALPPRALCRLSGVQTTRASG